MSKLKLIELVTTLLAGSASAPVVVPDLTLPTTNRLSYFYGGNGVTKPAGITASGDGGAVSSWQDMDSLVTAVQATGSAQPTYRLSVAAANNRGCVEGDGGDNLQASVGILSLQSSWTHACVVRTSHASGGTIVSEGRSSSNSPFIRFDTSGNEVVSGMRDNASTNASATGTTDINNNAPHLIVSTLIGTTLYVYVDNLTVAQATTSIAALGALTTDRLTFFALGRTTIAEQWDGQIFLDATWSGDALADLAASDIKTHYGIA
jgi:hypothetical protein